MKKRFREETTVDNNNVDTFNPVHFTNFHDTYMKESAAFKSFMSKVEGDIIRPRDIAIDTANKKADAAVDIAKSLESKMHKMERLFYWGIIIAVILFAWVLGFKNNNI